MRWEVLIKANFICRSLEEKMKQLNLMAAAAMSLAGVTVSANAETIEFWYGNTGRAEQAILASCEAYNASQSTHVVNCIGQGGYEEGMQKAIAAYRSQTHPVMIQFYDAGTLDVMLSDAVVPVSEIMPDVDWGNYINGVKSYYQTSTGDLYSQPYNGSTLLFYARMDELEKVGVTELPETYEGLYDIMAKLKKGGHECPFATDAHPWRVLEQFSARHGEPIASQNNGYSGLDAEYTFNQGLIAKHMNNLIQWREEGLIKLNQDTVAGKYNAAFNSGECAMMEGSTGLYTTAFEAHGENVKMAMSPMYEGYERRNTLIGGGSIWVMKGHDDAKIEAAVNFLTFLRQEDTQIDFAGATGYMPVTTSALTALVSSGKSKELAFATAELGVKSLSQPGTEDSRGIRLGFYTQFRNAFREETLAAFSGEQTMQEALDAAKTSGDELLRRFEQTYKGKKLP